MNRPMEKYADGAAEHSSGQARAAWDDVDERDIALVVDDDTERPRASANGAPGQQDVVRLAEKLRRPQEQTRSTAAAHKRALAVLHAVNLAHQTTIDALKRTNAELQHVIESTGTGTLVLDSRMRIRRFTAPVSAVFSVVAADRGSSLARIPHRLDYAGLAEDVRRVIGSMDRIEREVRSDTGESFIVRMNPLHSLDGEIDGAVLTFFDHTAQHRIEEELRDAKTVAELADLTKGRFLATLSHDLRSPLTAIMIFADSLRFGATLTSAQEEAIAGIKVGARHLASMIDGISGFAGTNAGRDVAIRQILDARVLAREVHALVAPAAAAKDLAFDLDLPDGIVALETDTGKTRRVLINLCENAVKYTTAGSIRLRILVDRDRVTFEVSDTGIGIAAEDQHRIFDRFWQADGRTIQNAGGMGIGLTAAREYGRFLGGDVEVESELGRGSTFRLWLPGVREGP